MCDPILVTLLKMRPHYNQSSGENDTPSSGTFPLATYKEVPTPPPPLPPPLGVSISLLWFCLKGPKSSLFVEIKHGLRNAENTSGLRDCTKIWVRVTALKKRNYENPRFTSNKETNKPKKIQRSQDNFINFIYITHTKKDIKNKLPQLES